MDENTEKILIEYVTDHTLDPKKDAINVIHQFCLKQPNITKTVYRGHYEVDTIKPGLWYSSSENKKISENDFSGPTCCLFIIHLIDVPCIDVNHWVGDKIGTYNREEEFIFLGGGTFYKNKSLTEEGFFKLEKTYKGKVIFECWYKLNSPQLQIPVEEPKKTKRILNSVKEVLDIIPEDEYEFITSKEDIILPENYEVSDEVLEKVLKKIQKMNFNGGKKRKTQKRKIISKKTSKRKTLRRKTIRKK